MSWNYQRQVQQKGGVHQWGCVFYVSVTVIRTNLYSQDFPSHNRTYSYQVCSQLINVNQPLIGSWMAKVCLRGCLNPSENSGIIIESLFCWLGPNFLNCMAFIVKRILWVPDTRIDESNGFGCTAKHPGLPICLECTLAATSSSVICWRRSLQQWSKPRSMCWFWGDYITKFLLRIQNKPLSGSLCVISTIFHVIRVLNFWTFLRSSWNASIWCFSFCFLKEKSPKWPIC